MRMTTNITTARMTSSFSSFSYWIRVFIISLATVVARRKINIITRRMRTKTNTARMTSSFWIRVFLTSLATAVARRRKRRIRKNTNTARMTSSSYWKRVKANTSANKKIGFGYVTGICGLTPYKLAYSVLFFMVINLTVLIMDTEFMIIFSGIMWVATIRLAFVVDWNCSLSV
uniref:Uncharacterized protein n=1 Tax=Manihot esculenta TaxID=3983 RepID=A0A2C9U999_MANES